MKEGCIPEDWKSSVVLPVYKGKGDPMECGSYRGIKLLEHAMKVVERIFEDRIWQQIDIDDMQFGFMKGILPCILPCVASRGSDLHEA